MKIRALRVLVFGVAGLAGCLPTRIDTALPGGDVRGLAVGDLDGDGRADIVVGHAPAPDGSGDLQGGSALLSQGDGTFRSKLVSLTGFAPDRLLLVDLNRDGKLDLVVSRRDARGIGSVRVFLGRGGADFVPAGSLEDVGAPLAIAAGDLDGDGIVDLVVSSAGPVGAPLQVHRGRGDGTFLRPDVTYAVAPSRELAVGDVSGDGKPDIVMGTPGGNVEMILNDGHGGLLAPIRKRVGEGEVTIALADLHGAGKLEIVAGAAGSKTLAVIESLGLFSTVMRYPLQSVPSALAVGDVNGDGVLDVVTIDTEASTLTILHGKKDGSYEIKTTLGVGQRPTAVALADVLGKGRPSVITANEKDGSVSVVLLGQ
jgi:hypothetical protein